MKEEPMDGATRVAGCLAPCLNGLPGSVLKRVAQAKQDDSVGGCEAQSGGLSSRH